MQLTRVVETSQRVTETTKRLEKVALLAALLRELQPEEIGIVVPFLAGAIRQGRIGIGYAALRDAQCTPSAVPTLQIAHVDRTFQLLIEISGSGSQRRRGELLHQLFSQATGAEQQFLIRLLMGELRQGALEAVVVEALARASGAAVERVRRAVMLAGDVAQVARALLENGETALAQYDIQLFRPIQPMLAGSADDLSEALEDLGEAALEYKMDGARVQVHRSGGDVVVYSRALNDVTAAVPEVVEAVRALPARDLILDGEVLSLHPDGRPQPFQITMRRFGRKLDVPRMREELPMTPFWFDLLYLNGGSLLDEPQSRRFQSLAEIAGSSLIPHTTTSDSAKADEFLAQSLQIGHEGIMAKALDARYAAGSRGQ